jgi:hypothetical protein
VNTVVLWGIPRLLAALACPLFPGALVRGKRSADSYPACQVMQHPLSTSQRNRQEPRGPRALRPNSEPINQRITEGERGISTWRWRRLRSLEAVLWPVCALAVVSPSLVAGDSVGAWHFSPEKLRPFWLSATMQGEIYAQVLSALLIPSLPPD